MQAPIFSNAPVFSLQTMLRTISLRYPVIPRLTPDGVFGERTLEAVMTFQREFAPPVTGRVDNDTWDTIAVLYQQVRNYLAPPLPCTGFPSRNYVVAPEEQGICIYLVQAMYRALSLTLENVESGAVDGRYTGSTVENTRLLQRASGQRDTGTLDKAAWDTLARLYSIFVTHTQTPPVTRAEALADPPAH